MQTATDALVLRDRKLDEQDRLLTLLSAEQGIITAYAKGAGRMKGSMAGATELLCYSHFVLFQNRDRCFADRAEANTLFFGIRGNLEKLTLATYFAQLCCELIPENEPAAEELRLMLNTLYYLEQGKLPPLQLKAILELRLLTLTGYMPDLIACRECGGLPEDGENAVRLCLTGGEVRVLRSANGGGLSVPVELRLLLCAYLGIDAQALLCEAPYIRVLAFDEMGRAVLRQAKKAGGLPLVNAGQTPPDTVYGALERRCAALYGLFAAQPELCPEQIARVYRK